MTLLGALLSLVLLILACRQRRHNPDMVALLVILGAAALVYTAITWIER